MLRINAESEILAAKLLNLPADRKLCLLDSCGVGHLGSHLLLAGIDPVETRLITDVQNFADLRKLDSLFLPPDKAAIFTLSYDLGLRLNNIKSRRKEIAGFAEPDIFIAVFDALLIHDYVTGQTVIEGNPAKAVQLRKLLEKTEPRKVNETPGRSTVVSNFSRESYLSAVENIKEHILDGETYQTNLTQQIHVKLAPGLTPPLAPEDIFLRLRKNHPAPFAAFVQRGSSQVVSASPERFFRVKNGQITTSPIKGTRRRGNTPEEDRALKEELLSSEKDRAENVMIVDLLRNDIGRICEYGSVNVEKLCDLEEHPTLFHLVSTISGKLRPETKFSDILQAVFPCGSITGAPKIRTIEIIDQIETAPRGLSMGAIGYKGFGHLGGAVDLNVAIRTMVVRGDEAVFNVGGGIVIDSEPAKEYEESLLKAKALLRAINAKLPV